MKNWTEIRNDLPITNNGIGSLRVKVNSTNGNLSCAVYVHQFADNNLELKINVCVVYVKLRGILNKFSTRVTDNI